MISVKEIRKMNIENNKNIIFEVRKKSYVLISISKKRMKLSNILKLKEKTLLFFMRNKRINLLVK